jgi:hypothetical protein
MPKHVISTSFLEYNISALNHQSQSGNPQGVPPWLAGGVRVMKLLKGTTMQHEWAPNQMVSIVNSQ